MAHAAPILPPIRDLIEITIAEAETLERVAHYAQDYGAEILQQRAARLRGAAAAAAAAIAGLGNA